MEPSIIKELNDSFLAFKGNHETELKKQGDQLQKQHDKLEEVDNNLSALLEKQTKMSGESVKSGKRYDKKAFEQFLRTGDSKVLTKSMEIATDSSGGYTHVPELGDQIIASVAQVNPLLDQVERITINANKFEEIYTTTRNANARAGEGDTRAETATANFEKNSIELFDLFSYPRISNELLHSAAFDLDAWLRQDIQEAFSEALSIEFIFGDGVKQSLGLLISTSADTIGGTPPLAWGSVHKETATTSITYGDLLKTISSLPVRYKAQGNVRWYMSTSAIEAVRGLVDANDLPIWRQDFGIAGAPMVLLGFQVIETPQLDGSIPVMFGDLKRAYRFVSHDKGLGILVDPYTMPGHTRFYASLQCAGGLGDSRALVALELV